MTRCIRKDRWLCVVPNQRAYGCDETGETGSLDRAGAATGRTRVTCADSRDLEDAMQLRSVFVVRRRIGPHS